MLPSPIWILLLSLSSSFIKHCVLVHYTKLQYNIIANKKKFTVTSRKIPALDSKVPVNSTFPQCIFSLQMNVSFLFSESSYCCVNHLFREDIPYTLHNTIQNKINFFRDTFVALYLSTCIIYMRCIIQKISFYALWGFGDLFMCRQNMLKILDMYSLFRSTLALEEICILLVLYFVDFCIDKMG